MGQCDPRHAQVLYRRPVGQPNRADRRTLTDGRSRGSSKPRPTPMANHEAASPRECPVRVSGGSRDATMAWLGLYGFAWSDYDTEARPAFDALTHGHVLEFLRLAPAYGGSLVERAPFALLPGLWGGGQLAVYRMVALPCLLAAAALGAWLVAQMRAAGRPTLGARSRWESAWPTRSPCARSNSVIPRSCWAVRCASPRCCSPHGSARCGPGWLWAWRSPTRSGHCLRSDRCCSRCPSRRALCMLSARARCGDRACAAGPRRLERFRRLHARGGRATERDFPAVAAVVVSRPPWWGRA